jgi:hypothetical protein
MRSLTLTVVLGACLIALYGLLMSSPVPVQAQSLPPRPPLPTVTPTPPPPPAAEEAAPRRRIVALGRITGTIIDLTTNAPMPGVAVRVGDRIMVSDANGNYDRSGVLPGSYDVVLALPADWGVPAQEVIRIDVAEGATIVQHLFYHGSLQR